MCEKYIAGEFDNLKANARQDGSNLKNNKRDFGVSARVVHFNKNTKKLITSFGCSNLNFDDIINGPGIDLIMIIDLSGLILVSGMVSKLLTEMQLIIE
mgnify:CR=1 FL=1